MHCHSIPFAFTNSKVNPFCVIAFNWMEVSSYICMLFPVFCISIVSILIIRTYF
jgi:hypothetical protein